MTMPTPPSPPPPPTDNCDIPRRQRFPKWGAPQRELWIDCMTDYSQTLLTLLGGQSEDHKGTMSPTLPSADLAEDAVRLAARLADITIEETQYRFWLQRPRITYAKSRPKPAPKPTRRRR